MQAIGFPSIANGVGAEASSGVLEAQLSRYQTQLADWCNCPSGKTPAGKEKIQELQAKVDAVKAQLERIATAKAPRQSTVERANRNPSSSGAAPAIGGLVDAFA